MSVAKLLDALVVGAFTTLLLNRAADAIWDRPVNGPVRIGDLAVLFLFALFWVRLLDWLDARAERKARERKEAAEIRREIELNAEIANKVVRDLEADKRGESPW